MKPKKNTEPRFILRQRQAIARIVRYWSALFEIDAHRNAFHLALTRILSRDLRFDSAVPTCVCHEDRPHDVFPHYCTTSPRTIGTVDGEMCDVLLEAVNKIGIHPDHRSAYGLFPHAVRVWTNGGSMFLRHDDGEYELLS